MPAKSKSQQRFFGMVHAGVIDKPKGMKDKDVEHFARTKHKDLPNKVKKKKKTKANEALDMTFLDFLLEKDKSV